MSEGYIEPCNEFPNGDSWFEKHHVNLKGGEKMDKCRVPENVLLGLDRYVHDRIPPGGFLRAVLENDLTESLKRADNDNRKILFYLIGYIFNELPYVCLGSPEKVKKWLGKEE